MTAPHDDGIVVDEAAMDHFTVDDYLQGPETLQRQELVWGVVRESPGPSYGHQRTVTDLVVMLQDHVRAWRLGEVCVAPIDVVLDADRSLIVQPDLIFVSATRLGIIREQVWGAPDLVVEVLSPGTRRRDLGEKLDWYARYGVRECWVVDRDDRRVSVHVFDGPARTTESFALDADVRSHVLPDLQVGVRRLFEAEPRL